MHFGKLFNYGDPQLILISFFFFWYNLIFHNTMIWKCTYTSKHYAAHQKYKRDPHLVRDSQFGNLRVERMYVEKDSLTFVFQFSRCFIQILLARLLSHNCFKLVKISNVIRSKDRSSFRERRASIAFETLIVRLSRIIYKPI